MYLDDSDRLFEQNKMPIRRKVVVRAPGGGFKAYADFETRPFCELGAGDLLDTADICMLYGCSARTVYRWMAEHKLKHSGKAGRNHFFRKDALIRWHNKHRPRPGRNLGS